jgi:hypothetical protein
MVAGERQGNRTAVHRRDGERSPQDARKAYDAEASLRQAMSAGLQKDGEDEAARQFRIGYAAATLGAVRFHQVLLTCRRGSP